MSTFHKVNIHTALTPSDIRKLLNPAFEQAKILQNTYQKKMQSDQDKQRAASVESERKETLESKSFLSSIFSPFRSTSASRTCPLTQPVSMSSKVPHVMVSLQEVLSKFCELLKVLYCLFALIWTVLLT